MKVGFFIGCNTSFNRPDLEQAVRHAFPALGIELDDLEGQSCCPTWGTLPSVDVVGWCAVSARNHTIAEQKGLDIVTVCGSCYGSLSEAKYKMEVDPELKAKVNEVLQTIGREYKGTSNVRLTYYYLYHEIGPEKIRASLKYTLGGLKVALQPGCHTLWPSKVYYDKEEDPFHPRVLKEMVEALGATVGHYTRLIDCCGMGAMRSTDMEKSLNLFRRKILSIKEEVDPDLIITGCSSCLIQFDTAQEMLRREKKINFEIPVLHFMQALAICLGADPEKVAGLARTNVKSVIGKILPS
ncbi:CoB--CoM heterodisulfide reductase iron-sulfur subunit B family protein [Desulfovirgula thermocuniculi]|uniref:CoB--CoM heterodisulfide reductase iron-sulfur subunit B family protein n=1 Tax=Desulfovirgula thermocuniculi TaxID=348842 RepID=UPI00040B6B38|nr:CoB--CoM heterodisulfide reductase iron-sulfur subunit B family protein [Desulfovirgula thermocuniculi]